MHQVLTQNQETTEALIPATGETIDVPLIRGDWKRQVNNPMRSDGLVHEYCPPEQVASEMENLISWHRQHQENKIPPEVEAAWLHHRFTQIHPFQDGNGRVARCLASLVFLQAGWFPLSLTRDERVVYLDALERADRGDLSPLIQLFSKRQKQAFIRSLGLSEQILAEGRRTQIAIAAIAEKLKQNQSATRQDRCNKVEGFANLLYEIAIERLDKLAEDIKASIEELVNGFDVFTVVPPRDGSKSYYHRFQVAQTAKQLGSFANIHAYHDWMQLAIDLQTSTIILLSFHVLGHEYRGLLVCSACAYHKDVTEEGDTSPSDIQALSESPFQFSYADEEYHLIERFRGWLEDVLVTGLEYWNSSL